MQGLVRHGRNMILPVLLGTKALLGHETNTQVAEGNSTLHEDWERVT